MQAWNSGPRRRSVRAFASHGHLFPHKNYGRGRPFLGYGYGYGVVVNIR